MHSLDPRGWAPGIRSPLPCQYSWNYTVRIAVEKKKTLEGSTTQLGYTQRSRLWLPCWALCLPRLEDLFMVWRTHGSFQAVPILAGGFSPPPKNQHDITEEQLRASFQPLGYHNTSASSIVCPSSCFGYVPCCFVPPYPLSNHGHLSSEESLCFQWDDCS